MTANSPSNVNDLYGRLQRREYCCRLGLPQTEKDNLLGEVKSRLTQDGVRFATIKLERGLLDHPDRRNSEQDWYLGFIRDLANQFGLLRNSSYINFREDVNKQEDLEDARLLLNFIENVLLREVRENIVIFVGELDGLLNLNSFSDDFKTRFLDTICFCYEQRANAPQENNFNRLTFAVFGTEEVLANVGIRTHPCFTEVLKDIQKENKITKLKRYLSRRLEEIEINTSFGSIQASTISKIIQDLCGLIKIISKRIGNLILSKLEEFKKKIRQIPRWLIFLLILGLVALSLIFLPTIYQQWNINRQANLALKTFKFQEIEALEIALQAGNSLTKILKKEDTVIAKPLEALQTIFNQIHEKNRFTDPDQESQFQMTAVAFNPSGTKIAAGGSDGRLLLWDKSGKLLKKVNTEQGKIFSLMFNSNNELIATGGEDGSVKLWDSETLDLQQPLSPCNNQPIRALSFSNYDQGQENYLAVGGDDGKVCVWEITNRQSKKIYEKIFQGNIYTISFNPKTKNIAIGTGSGDIEEINLEKDSFAKDIFKLPLEDVPFNISFNSSGTRIVAAGKEGTVQLWEWSPQQISDKNKPKEINSWDLYKNPGKTPFLKVLFTDDDKLLAIAENEKLEVWELLEQKGNKKLLADLKGYGTDPDNNQAILKDKLAIVSASFNTKTQNLVTTTEENQVRLWDLSVKNKPTWTFPTGKASIKKLSVVFNSKNTLTSIATLDKNGKVKLWSIPIKGQKINSKDIENQDKFTSISFVPQDDLIATANKSGVLEFRNLQGSKSLPDIQTGLREITSISFETDSGIVAVADINGAIELWDWRANNKKDTQTSNQGELESLIFMKENKLPILITIGKGNGNISYWKLIEQTLKIKKTAKNSNLVNQLQDNNLEYDHLAIGLSQWAISKANNQVEIRDLRDGNLLGNLSSDLNEITSMTLSPDGRYIVAGGDDGRVQVWLLSLEDLLKKGCEWLKDYYANPHHIKPEISKACLI